MTALTAEQARIAIGWLCDAYHETVELGYVEDVFPKVTDMTANETGAPSLFVELSNGDVLELRAVTMDGAA